MELLGGRHMEQNQLIGNRLKELRMKEKLSQAACAKLAGCSQAAINRYEHGESQAPYDVIVWYAKYFHVSVDYIFGLADAPKMEDWHAFIEECFQPGTVLNTRLKDILIQLADNGKDAQ